jgi:protein-serine/threonine kinase
MIDGLEPSPFLSINTSDLVWHRLPTPAPSERSGSVLSSLSSREPSPQPSSFRSSRQDSERGSITTDEVFSRPPSPLPSALSPTTDKDESTPLSAGEKTSAFFATPFSISTPRLPHDDADAHTGTDYLNSHLTKITGEPSRSSRSKSLKHRKFDEGDTNADDGHSQGSPQHSVSHRVPPSLHLTPHHYRPISRKPSGELDEDHVSQLPSPTSTPIPSRRELVDLNDDPTPRKLSSSPDRSIPLVRHIRGLGHGRTKDPETGDVIGDEQTRLCLLRLLGRGAFSTVWLATDEDGTLGACKPDERPRSQSFARRKGDRKVQGLKPLRSPNTSVSGLRRQFTTVLDERVGEGAMLTAALVVDSVETRVVAVKLMDRAVCATNDRTRISFVREVEVLRVSLSLLEVAYI